jgi:hypothetical protein
MQKSKCKMQKGRVGEVDGAGVVREKISPQINADFHRFLG